MQVQVARWGNNLGLRIPKDMPRRAGLREGARVDVEAEGNRIIISPARLRYVLADLLKGMTPEAMREAFDWGPDRGREIVGGVERAICRRRATSFGRISTPASVASRAAIARRWLFRLPISVG